MHRQALGEPARHVRIGHREGEDVAHFMPQGGGPMELAGRAAGGAVHGDGVAERHAQRAQAGHAQRAHREIVVVGVDLHLHRLLSLNRYFFS